VGHDLELHDARKQALVFYGAGTLGAHLVSKLQELGIRPAAFADDTPEKWGQTFQGIPVMSPVDAVARFGSSGLFVVTILNPALSFLRARARLEGIGPCRVISFLSLCWNFADALLPYYQFELPERLLTKAERIRAAFELWADEESRRQFVAHLRFRLFIDHEALPLNEGQGYFPDIFPELHAQTVFVDCGAYDGDSIREFLVHQQHRFGRIYAFEPDEANFLRLKSYVESLPLQVSQKIVLHNAGVGETKTRVAFNATGNMSAALASTGIALVNILPLDEIVERDGNPIFLKLDVEGAEWRALEGARNLIKESEPTIALSVYHQPDDLWELPLLISSLVPSYRFYLRTQGEDGMDVICYAAPAHQ